MDLRSKGGGGERSTRISTSNQVPRRSSIIFVSKFGTLLLCLLFFIFFASSVQAATYYVSKAGSDSNTATQAQSQETPWLTLQHAEDTANDGDTIYVSAGTYTENDSSTHGWDVSKAITWIATGEVTVKAQTGSSYRPLTVSGTGVGSYTGFIFDGEEAKSQTAQLVAGSSNKTFTNCTFKGATSWLVYAVDTSNLTVQNSTFESTNSAVTIVKGGALTNAVFENNTFNITAASLIASAINTVTFNSNTINATLSGTMFTSGARTGDYVLSNNVIILGGTPVSIQASGATDAGTMTWDSNDITVSSVTSGPVFNLFRGATNISFTNNDIKVEDPSQTQVVIYLNNQTSPVITGNTVETFNNTGTISAVVSVGSSDGTGGGIPQIKNNVIKARHSSGKIISVGTEGSTAGDNTYDGAIIENNTLYGPLYYDPDLNGVTNHAIFVGYNKNASIKYNTVIGGGYGVVVKGGGMAYTGGGIFYNKFIDCVGIASIHVKGIQDINVYNNTIFAQDSFVGPYYLIWIKQNAAGELGTGASLRNNIIYGGTGSNRNIYIGSESISGFSSDYNLLYRHDGDSYGYNGMTDYDFSEWQGLGYDLHSIDNDPAFIETNGLDFRLSYSSPAINTGTDVSQALDYIGSTVPQGSTPDIGAYEFLTPSSSPLSLAQYKSDGTTILTTSTINSENTVVLKFTMASSNPLDLLTPQIEIQKVGTNFTNSVTHTGTAVSYSGSSGAMGLRTSSPTPTRGWR